MNKNAGSFSRLFRYLRCYWPAYAGGGFFMVALEAIFQVMVAVLLKHLVDATLAGDLSRLVKGLLQMGFALLAVGGILPWALRTCMRAVELAAQEMRQDLFDHIQTLPMSYHESTHSGDSVSRITNDISTAKQAFGSTLLHFVGGIVSAVVCAVYISFISWKLFLISLTLGILPLLFNRHTARPLRDSSTAVQASLAGLNTRLKDLLSGITVVRAFNLSHAFTSRYATANTETRKQGIRLVSWQGLVSAINEFLGSGNFMAILGLGSYLIIRGEITPGDVMAATQLSNGLVNPLRQLGDLWVGLQTSIAAAERVFAVLDEQPESLQPGSDIYQPEQESFIGFDEVSFSYGERVVLRDISLHVPKGSVVALAGPSGGGKSTLFKLLLGFYQAASGQISVNGRDIGSYSLEELRQCIAFVPQESYLYDGTILENIRLGRPEANHEEIISAAQAANAHDFIMGLPQGYETQVGERGAQLSGGQRQRIAIARALLKDAPILLLDEATSSLDSESEQLVQDALERLMQGRTTLVIAHRLSTIRNADCIHVVADGSVAESGTHDELMELNGVYRKLHDMQLRDAAA